MTHPKEAPSTLLVYTTAYLSYEPFDVNEVLTDSLTRMVMFKPDCYGLTVDADVIVTSPTAATRTLCVYCNTEHQAADLLDLSVVVYGQPSVLVVDSKTHTASRWEIVDAHTVDPKLKVTPVGTFQKQNTGSDQYYTIRGERWEVSQ